MAPEQKTAGQGVRLNSSVKLDFRLFWVFLKLRKFHGHLLHVMLDGLTKMEDVPSWCQVSSKSEIKML
jgi:hypothetical protein